MEDSGSGLGKEGAAKEGIKQLNGLGMTGNGGTRGWWEGGRSGAAQGVIGGPGDERGREGMGSWGWRKMKGTGTPLRTTLETKRIFAEAMQQTGDDVTLEMPSKDGEVRAKNVMDDILITVYKPVYNMAHSKTSDGRYTAPPYCNRFAIPVSPSAQVEQRSLAE